LRGKKSEDVIFPISQPLGMAEVFIFKQRGQRRLITRRSLTCRYIATVRANT
jgi:hypothetical protein